MRPSHFGRFGQATAALWACLPFQSVTQLPPAPVTASDPPGLNAAPTWNEPARGEPVLGELREEPLGLEDDGVPLPEASRFATGEHGDTLLAPAGGDPYFLGFAAGRYYPPAGERIDPELLQHVQASWTDGRPRQETYAFVMFQKRITPERKAGLEALGARILEFHPHYCLKVALPVSAIDAVAYLDFVRWVGVPRTWQKVHPDLERAFAEAAVASGGAIDAYVNVYDSDMTLAAESRVFGTREEGDPSGVRPVSADDLPARAKEWTTHGWQETALRSMGVEPRSYEDGIRAFRVTLRPQSLPALLASDFVQFVEPKGTPSLAHDESMPMTNLDRTRVFYDGDTNSAAVAGQIDSGLDYSHQGLNGFFWWANNLTGTSEATTTDLCGHGSHVAGTIHGGGAVSAAYKGAADKLGWGATGRYFNTKLFSGAGCTFGGASMATILGVSDGPVTDGSGNVTPAPHVLNHSWGTPGGPFLGSEADCRTIDNNVFNQNQLQVWAAGNEGSGGSTLRREPSSKNAFTVGAVVDYEDGALNYPGTIAGFSSRGPTADDRWKPNVCAPGDLITSVDAGTGSGYVKYQGTSMAAPHVTGLAAQLMDHLSFLRYNPSTTAALIMASAITKNNALLTTPSAVSTDHLNRYGAGRVDAWRSHFTSAQQATYYYGWTWGGGSYLTADVPISAGATRITVVMTYHEAASSSGASQALVNNLDLFVDAPPLTSGGNTGEYTAQQSVRDNTEVRSLDNPVAGTWRMKIWPTSQVSTVKVGLAVVVTYGDTTPDPTLVVSASDSFIKPNQIVDVSASYSNPEFVASAVYLESLDSGNTITAAKTTLGDGAVTNLIGNVALGRELLLGDVMAGTSRTAQWTTRWSTEGVKPFSVRAVSDNAIDKAVSVNVTVDGTPPGVATGLASPTHTAGVWSNNPSVQMTWTTASDNLSGIGGYATSTTLGAPALPSAIQSLGNVTTTSFTLPATSGTWFNLRAFDKSSNWSASGASFGPFKIDLVQPSFLTGLKSTTHQVGVVSCQDAITMAWNPQTDDLSGIAGFSTLWDHNPDQHPGSVINVFGNVTSHSYTLPSSSQPWYFHITPWDNAGNGQNHYNAGPYYVNTTPVTTFCTAKTSSSGCVPVIATSGQPSASAGSGFVITASQVEAQKTGIFFWSTGGQNNAPFQGAFLCVKPPIHRSGALASGGAAACSGAFALDFNVLVAGGSDPALVQGATVDGQFWYRDPSHPVNGTGLSGGVEFLLCK